MQGYSIPETTRAYGAVLLNADGEEFTDSLDPRDVVSEAIFSEVAGTDLREFFDRYVHGTEDPPLAALLDAFGFPFKREVDVSQPEKIKRRGPAFRGKKK